MTNPDWLERVARRSRSEPWTLGHAFERYRELEGRTQEELAKELGCTLEVLHWLSVCRRPEGQDFTEQASAIASRFAVELLPLVRVLRHVEVMEKLSQRDEPGEDTEEQPMQLAARDRVQDDEPHS
jgi:hypothetical protein